MGKEEEMLREEENSGSGMERQSARHARIVARPRRCG